MTPRRVQCEKKLLAERGVEVDRVPPRSVTQVEVAVAFGHSRSAEW